MGTKLGTEFSPRAYHIKTDMSSKILLEDYR